MHPQLTLALATSALLGMAAFAGSLEKKAVQPAEEDHWKFQLSTPGWLANIEGDVGIGGHVSHVDVNTDSIIRRIDMAASLRGEASKGRFGIMGDFLYLSLSDGIGTDTAVKKVDIQLDQTLAELALRWRLVDSPRASLDVIGGVRYTNLYQKAAVQADAERIDDASTRLVDAIGEKLATALTAKVLNELIAADFSTPEAPTFNGGRNDRPGTLPIGPIAGRLGPKLHAQIQQIVAAKQAELQAALRTARAAVGAARVAAQARVDDLKKDLSRQIAKAVESKLDTRVARTDDWFDPFIGLRGRYHFNDRIYVTARGDVGGFGVGADFTWQASAALGVQLSDRIFAEAGYRILGVDYRDDGLIYDVRTHGAEINLGITF